MEYKKLSFKKDDRRLINFMHHFLEFSQIEKMKILSYPGGLLCQPIDKWCREVYGPPFEFKSDRAWGWSSHGNVGMYFKRKEDALMFKLKWG